VQTIVHELRPDERGSHHPDVVFDLQLRSITVDRVIRIWGLMLGGKS
jgi:hypothetical protein